MDKASLRLSVLALLAALCLADGAVAGCVEGVGPNNERMPCMPDDWRPSGGGGGGGGGPVIHVPTPRDRAADKVRAGNVFWQQDQWEKAIALYREALVEDPSYQLARDVISRAYSNWGNDLLHQNNWADAEWAYRKALEAGGDASNSAYNGLGIVYRKLDRYAEAEAYFNRALGIDPNNEDALYNLQSLRRFLERQAEAARRRAATEHYNGLVADAEALMQAENWTLAEARLRELIELDPNQPWNWSNLGEILLRLGRYDEAIEAYRRRLGLAEADWVRDRIAFAERKRQQARMERAIAETERLGGSQRVAALRALIGSFPDQATDIRFKIAETYQAMGDTRGYLDALHEVIDNSSRETNVVRKARRELDDFWVKRANESINAEDPIAIIEALRGLKTARPVSPRILWLEGRAYDKLDHHDDAIAIFRDGLRQFPDDPDLLRELAFMLFKHGDNQEAARLARRANELDPGDDWGKELQERIDDYEGSIMQFVNEYTYRGGPLAFVEDKIREAIHWYKKDNIVPPPDLQSTAQRDPDQPTSSGPETVPGGFGATAPPSPVVGPPPEPGRFAALKGKVFEATPEPVVKMGQAAVDTTLEVWDRAKTEAADMTRASGIEWAADKVRYGKTLVSLVEKSKDLYQGYSKPIYAHFNHSMALARAIAEEEASPTEGGMDRIEAEKSLNAHDQEVQKMTTEMTRKSMEWGISGGILPDGKPSGEKMSLADKAVEYVERAFKLDQLWAFNRENEVEKWTTARQGR